MSNIQAIINKYAKETKASKAKLKLMADEILSTLPKNAAGKPVSTLSSMIRDLLRQQVGQKFTSKEIAVKIGVDHVTVNNNLRYLKEQEKIAQVVGERRTGERGKPSLVWTITA